MVVLSYITPFQLSALFLLVFISLSMRSSSVQLDQTLRPWGVWLFHWRMTSRVSGNLNDSSPPHTSAEKDRMIGIILVMPMNLPKMKVLMIAASLHVPFSTPKAVALRTQVMDQWAKYILYTLKNKRFQKEVLAMMPLRNHFLEPFSD